MKKITIAIAFISMFIYFPQVLAQSPVGKWTIYDDKTGAKKATAQLSVDNGVLNGLIVETFPPSDGEKRCIKCSGDFKNKAVLGLPFLWGLKEVKEGAWENGHVIDPKSGRIYRVKISVKNDKLYVRGYVGVSLLGRNQIWMRAS